MPILELAALLAGAVLPVQASINGRLGRDLNSPVLATLISFVAGTVALGLYALAIRIRIPAAADLGSIPWWAWTGGAMGAVYVTGVVYVTPKIGVGAAMALVITGQIVTSALLDHFGAFGIDAHPVDFRRLIGFAMVIIGALLVRRT